MLSPADEFAIRELYARYNAYVDTGAYDDWAACFTEDGVFSPAVESGGRAAIAAIGKARFEARASQPWKQPQHWNSNLLFSADSNESSATAICYIMRLVTMKDSLETVANVLGIYQDHIVKQEGRWLFRSRKVTQDTLPPGALPKAS